MKLFRLLSIGLLALILSAPATAAVSEDGHGGVYANLSTLAKIVTELG